MSKKATWAWALWDWAEQPYPTIMQTFIFATYLTSSSFGDPDTNTQLLSNAGILAGLLVMVSAPIFGRKADEAGKRKFWLLINSAILIAIMALSYFVEPKPEFLVFGLVLYALGGFVQESAFVNYYAMLKQVTTSKNMAKVSGYAWALGYVGGIILLVLSLVGFYLPGDHWFGITETNAENIRVMFLLSAVWMTIFTIPLLLFVPEVKPSVTRTKESLIGAYISLWKQLKELRAKSPETLKFLIASAVFRDGLAGVFTFGAILGSVAFGFSTIEVIGFGIVANIVAGIGAFVGGAIDAKVGTRTTIVASLIGIIVGGIAVFALADLGPITYWIFGLLLCLFVGPAQASARTFMARVTPAGREGEVFGLYQTTGRAASFLSPTFWSIATALAATAGVTNQTIYGIIGIVLVTVVGLILLLRVNPKPQLIN